MSVSTSTSVDGATVTIVIRDRFGFGVHREFRKAYQSAAESHGNYIVDLRDVGYIDSSGLGMLLQLVEYAGNRREAVRVTNACPAVMDILRVAKFDKLMTFG